MNQNNESLFKDAPIPKAVAQMAVPTVLSMLVVVVYNMVDTFFVGQTGDTNQVAAVSVATPVFLILMAFGNMFGIGGSSLISRLLGGGEHGRAKQVSAFCCYGSLIWGVVMVALTLASMPVILKAIGTDADTVGFAGEYLRWIALGAPFIIFGTAFGNLIRAEGAATASMAGNMVGTVVNIILDPIMILGLGWGVRGAAIATVLGNLAASVFYLLYFVRGKSALSIHPRDFAARGVIGGVIAIGLPASLNNILMSATNILLNNFLILYGAAAVAAMGVAMKANMLVVFVQLGLAMGIQPLVGYAFGAKNVARLRGIVKFSIVCTTVMGVILTAVYWFGAERIISVFIDDAAVISAGVPMLRALMVSAPVLGVLFVLTNALQAMGRAAASMVLSISRQGFIFVPCLFLFNALLGLDGIIYTQPIADLCSIVIAVALFVAITHKLSRQARQNALDAACTC
ncbi:MAG: MATE family efflux transporter [Eubacteriales bacterium]|nr:MATE family efflux transporter [Eubacteriales bacterium]